ncbi:MAG TPA: hypothetical protein VFQ35_07545, partial [Polyangiaceae bacterium]|nr:hypothetical protein [Polyangiaceae bacterium]
MTRSVVTAARRLGTGLSLVGLFVGSSLTGCGARSSLLSGEPQCRREGEERPCSNPCGVGVQACEDGVWQACEVAPTSRACSDACGNGSQICEKGVWGLCEVPDAQRACQNDCGNGVQRCRASVWGACEVPVTTMPCEDACGVGSRTCQNGLWSTCVGPLVTEECESVCGKGKRTCDKGAWLPCDAPLPNPPVLAAVIRDFTTAHPDFERPFALGNGLETGIVEAELGPDDLPVYASSTNTRTTSGREAFDQWYRDVPGVNLSIPYTIRTTPSQ